MSNLSNRLDRLEQAGSGDCIWIQMRTEEASKDEALWETEDQAKTRWLADHPDRMAELERARVRFIRRVIVAPPVRAQVGNSEGDQP
jgi:hypothetical protein